MSTETAMHKRNLESSILFMQQEHAATLKDLHEEISTLQKRCTDLTFQLTMHGLTIDEPGTVDNKMQEVKQELEQSRAKITKLEQEVSEKDKRIERLEAEARTQRKRWLDESRTQSQTMNSLRAELEAKANNIAYLTTELHRLKQKQRSEDAKAENSGSQNVRVHANPGIPNQPGYIQSDSAQSQKKLQTHHHYMPAPPPREKTLGSASTNPRYRRSGHSKSVTGTAGTAKPLLAVHPASADALIRRPTNALRHSSGRSSGSESPDITPFLPQPKEVVSAVGEKQAPVLPPIPASSATTMGVSGSAHPVLVHQVVSSTSQHRQKKAGSSKAEAAIVTLAVENAAAPDGAWTFAHESRSSEYN